MASSDHLKPGERGKITAKIDIEGGRGLISKGITVSSNDPERPIVNLSLRAAIK